MSSPSSRDSSSMEDRCRKGKVSHCSVCKALPPRIWPVYGHEKVLIRELQKSIFSGHAGKPFICTGIIRQLFPYHFQSQASMKVAGTVSWKSTQKAMPFSLLLVKTWVDSPHGIWLSRTFIFYSKSFLYNQICSRVNCNSPSKPGMTPPLPILSPPHF